MLVLFRSVSLRTSSRSFFSFLAEPESLSAEVAAFSRRLVKSLAAESASLVALVFSLVVLEILDL